MRVAVALGCLAVGLGAAACSDGDDRIDGLFTPAEWSKLSAFSPLGPPKPSPTNRYADDPAAAAFGQRMWFERRYSGEIVDQGGGALGAVGETGKIGCVDCHDQHRWFYDTRSMPNTTSLGTYRSRRNSPSMVNVAYYDWGGWGGAQDQFWKQGANAPESRDMNGDRLRLAHVIYDHYRDDYNALFDPDLPAALALGHPEADRFPARGKPKASPGDPAGAWEGMELEDQRIINRILANVGKSFEAYERRLISRDAPFDRYVAGEDDAISASAKRGLKLFIGKAACDACHSDSTFTDNQFHNTGVPQTADPPDDGRFADIPRLTNTFSGAGEFSDDPAAGAAKLEDIAQTADQKGRFRTKSLRHVAETAPYFHDGSMPTLESVVRFYDSGGAAAGFPGEKSPLMVPLNLSEQEIRDLVAFLETLTGAPVPEELTIDTSAP